MGTKDEYQFDYLDDNERFADQINGALFGGRQVVKPEELEPAEAQTVVTGKRGGTENIKTIVDKVRLWKGKKLHILAVENQNYVDYRMVLRNMLSESVGYQKQWKRKKRAHEKLQDLKDGDEYLSGMKKDEKFAPIITLVVYFGTDGGWNGARCLHDLLDIDEELKEYVVNYRLNLYDCHEHDTFEEYKTGLRQIFETVRYVKDEEKLLKIMKENREAYSRIDSETRDMLEMVANIRIPEECRVLETGKEGYNMCDVFERIKIKGYEEGIEKGIRVLIEAYQELGMSQDIIAEKCAEKYDISNDIAKKYVKECCV